MKIVLIALVMLVACGGDVQAIGPSWLDSYVGVERFKRVETGATTQWADSLKCNANADTTAETLYNVENMPWNSVTVQTDYDTTVGGANMCDTLFVEAQWNFQDGGAYGAYVAGVWTVGAFARVDTLLAANIANDWSWRPKDIKSFFAGVKPANIKIQHRANDTSTCNARARSRLILS